MSEICWHCFSWEAFATLTTGILAVVAATCIGFRQSKIQSRQVDLKENELKVSLFDRRYEVYERFKSNLSHIMTHARPASDNEFLALSRAALEAEFLFNEETIKNLGSIRSDIINFMTLDSQMQAIYQAEGHYGDGNPQCKKELLVKLANHLSNLPNVFEEMKLGKWK